MVNLHKYSISSHRQDRGTFVSYLLGGIVPLIALGIVPYVLSQAVVGMFARVVAWWVADPSRATREEVIESLTRIQLSGTQPE